LLDRAFGGFFSGRIFESLLIGLISLCVFYLTGMPYPPLLAVILAIFNLIPYFGSIFAGVVGGIIVLVADPSMVIWFLVIDLVMEQIDGNILAPRVLGDTVGMHPLCIFVSITVMGNLLGVAGLIIGVPIAAVVIEAVKYVCRVRESKTADSADRESVVG
jgi:predicted PurR-regulated permease PerM